MLDHVFVIYDVCMCAYVYESRYEEQEHLLYANAARSVWHSHFANLQW